jgi:hypothetical protein
LPVTKWLEAEPEGLDSPDYRPFDELPTGELIAELEARGYLVVRTDRMIAFGKLHETAGRFDLPDPYGNYPRGRRVVLSD